MKITSILPSSLEDVCEIAKVQGLYLDSSSLRKDETGSDFLVYHCKDTTGRRWVLRFPRRQSVAEGIAAEKRLLDLVQDRINIPVPDWQIVSDHLIAYPRLTGRPAASEDLKTGKLIWTIDQSNPPDVYIDGLAQTMANLHKIPTELAATTGIPVRTPEDVKKTFADKLERGRRELKMHDSWYERGQHWLLNDEWWPKQTVLIHGDLHPGHTLVDESGKITGLLDWSDAEIGDPGAEFIECSRKFPPETVERLLEAYERHGGHIWKGLRENIREGIAFAPLTLGLMGIDTSQPRYVERGNAGLSTSTSIPEDN